MRSNPCESDVIPEFKEPKVCGPCKYFDAESLHCYVEPTITVRRPEDLACRHYEEAK